MAEDPYDGLRRNYGIHIKLSVITPAPHLPPHLLHLGPSSRHGVSTSLEDYRRRVNPVSFDPNSCLHHDNADRHKQD